MQAKTKGLNIRCRGLGCELENVVEKISPTDTRNVRETVRSRALLNSTIQPAKLHVINLCEHNYVRNAF